MVPRSLKRQFPKLKKVFDAKRPVHVTVSDKDAKNGKQGDAQNCAMARAMCREFKADVAIIGMSYSYVINGDTAVRYKTPNTVSREITSFDRNHDFRPGDYRLSPIAPSQRLGKGGGQGPHKPTHDHKAKRHIAKTVGVRQMPRGG